MSQNKISVVAQFGVSLVKLCPGYVFGYLFLSLLSQTAIPLALPVLVGHVTNLFTASQQVQETGVSGATSSYMLWLLLSFALIPLSIWFKVAQTAMDCQMERHLRLRLFDKVIRQAPEFFREYPPSQLTNILTQTTLEAQQALRSLAVDPILQMVSLVAAALLIVNQLREVNGNLVWPIVGAMVLFGIISTALTQLKGEKPIFAIQSAVMDKRFSLTGLADSAVNSPEEIQAMDATSHFSQRYGSGLDQLMTLKRRQILTMEWINSAVGLPTQIVLAFLYGLIVFQAVGGHGNIRPGVFIVLAGLTPQLMLPFRTFAMLGVIANASWPAVELINRLMALENRIKDQPDAHPVESLAPSLEARNVTFRYNPGSEKIFDRLSFSVAPGKITGFVARMGQGKTSFFRLALRFYDPEEGQILLGGVSTTSLSLDSLRRHVAMMSQFPAFFHDSVRENFKIAKADATDQEIRQLCEQTGVWQMLEKALGPNPLDQNFSAGKGLSGGQQRLFALTRCLLRSPTFLFLDEPTTNMSNDEKYQLIPILRAACAGRTVMVVDHDLSWITQFTDRLVVLDHGRIVQEGTAEELSSELGLFKELSTHEAPPRAEAPPPPQQQQFAMPTAVPTAGRP